MGCAYSAAPKVSQSPGQRQKSPHNSSPNTPRTPSSQKTVDLDLQRAKSDFQKIMANVGYIPKPANMVPVVCFSDYAVPLVVAPLCLEEGDTTNVLLPAMCLSHHGPGRIVLIGQIQLLVQCAPTSQDAALFLENLIHWASASSNQTRILLLGLPSHIVPFIQKNMAGLEYRILAENDSHHVTKVHVIICMSNCEYQKELEVFLSRGGGLICCAAENNENNFPMNNLLRKAGVGFPTCPLAIGPINAPTLKTTPHFSEISVYTFKTLAMKYKEVIDKSEIDINDLDNVITSLRYHIQCMDQSENKMLRELYQTASDFLKKQNYETESGICPELIQNVTAALMVETQSKLPASFFVGINESDTFPGQPDTVTAEEATIHVKTVPEGWFSTCFYLPPGVLAHVKLNEEPPQEGLIIQVGAHAECMISKPGPWMRWPLVVTDFLLNGSEIDISSPYGGNVYVISESKKEVEFDMTITNVMPYPCWPDNIWDKLPEYTIPFCEINTKFTTITAPTSEIRKIDDLQKFADKIDKIIKSILVFFSEKKPRHFRIVFDIELPEDGPLCGYPILLHYDSIQEIILNDNPTCDLFSLTMFIAVLTLPDGALEADKEASLAHIASCVAFMKSWPDKSPMEYSTVMVPSLFNKLWDIYQKHKEKFPKALGRAKDEYSYDKKGAVDMWAVFVQELSLACNETFPDLIEKPKPINATASGMVMSMSSQNLQNYVLSDDDEIG